MPKPNKRKTRWIGKTTFYELRRMIRDLDDYLTVFPDRLQVREVRDRLWEV